MKSLYPKISKILSSYALPKIGSKYTKKVQGYQMQGYQGIKGKYFGKYASKINLFKGGGFK